MRAGKPSPYDPFDGLDYLNICLVFIRNDVAIKVIVKRIFKQHCYFPDNVLSYHIDNSPY